MIKRSNSDTRGIGRGEGSAEGESSMDSEAEAGRGEETSIGSLLSL